MNITKVNPAVNSTYLHSPLYGRAQGYMVPNQNKFRVPFRHKFEARQASANFGCTHGDYRALNLSKDIMCGLQRALTPTKDIMGGLQRALRCFTFAPTS
jgi:hypothetical protein